MDTKQWVDALLQLVASILTWPVGAVFLALFGLPKLQQILVGVAPRLRQWRFGKHELNFDSAAQTAASPSFASVLEAAAAASTSATLTSAAHSQPHAESSPVAVAPVGVQKSTVIETSVAPPHETIAQHRQRVLTTMMANPEYAEVLRDLHGYYNFENTFNWIWGTQFDLLQWLMNVGPSGTRFDQETLAFRESKRRMDNDTLTVEQYLRFLLARELIERVPDSQEIYRITKTGEEFVK